MKLSHIPGSIRYQCGNSIYSFLSTGDIYRFESGPIMINGFTGTKKEGSANNIWLRIYREDSSENGIAYYPLLGIRSASRLIQDSNCLKYYGEIHKISYEVTFIPSTSAWFWEVNLTPAEDARTVDLIYGQDLGMADKTSLLDNELYTAQYLGHTVLKDTYGYHICSRQNLAQSTGFPYIHQGILNAGAIGYSTDGLQFFGLSYKARRIPSALSTDLPNLTLQYENSYISLQSERFRLNSSRKIVFYGYFTEDHPESISAIEYLNEIQRAYSSFSPVGNSRALPSVRVRSCFGSPFTSEQWEENRINELYPKRIQEEFENGRLLSFFTPEYAHVVLQQKELLTERPHGNIITTAASTTKVNNNLITSTNYISGIFNSQTVIGNTTKHKFLSVSRGLMDLLKNSGQRIWIRLHEQYRLLDLPALFETGMNYSRWLYQLEDDILRVTSFAVKEETKIVTEVESLRGKNYDFVITCQLVLGTSEFSSDIILEDRDGVLRFRSADSASTPYPGLHYDLYIPDTQYTWSDDRIFFEDNTPQNTGLLTLSVKGKNHFQIILCGALEESPLPAPISADFESGQAAYNNYYRCFMNHFCLRADGTRHAADIEKLNIISRWYCHNALIHFAVPHGLEQSGGAAWGTRDVCQGPMELFFATQKFSLAREVLLNIFSHQSQISGEWPQWFMFDRYTDRQTECHGDVIFWPLKCLGDYLRHTGDHSVLSEALPFIDAPDESAQTLKEHVQRAAASIEQRFLSGTHLISYAGGDWDDTLQPADSSMKDNLVSSWTQALAFQVLQLLHETLDKAAPELASYLGALADRIKEDFNKYLIIDNIIPGFVCRMENGSFAPMLHPEDAKTGIHYRLLPLSRSILSNIIDQEMAEKNIRLIQQHLYFPDGVRLMDRPASYHGGVSHLFLRAEQAANVGREISLQYTHAHIRYIEALCKMNRADIAWRALMQITPVNLKNVVPNAAFRQSNLYYSSSDGNFINRYDYEENFQKLRTGSIEVKGGWRIYSSGPGIYLHRLICDILGIQISDGSLFICPTLPASLDGLELDYSCFGYDFTFHYHIAGENSGNICVKQSGQILPASRCSGKYRNGGVCIKKDCLSPKDPDIHIYIS